MNMLGIVKSNDKKRVKFPSFDTFLKHKKTEKSITVFKSLSILLTKTKFTSIAKNLLSKNGVNQGIQFHNNRMTTYQS